MTIPRVYSWRFHNHSVGSKTWEYWVPAGKRAVVRWASVTAYAIDLQAGVSVNGVPLWLPVFQEAPATRTLELRGVAYEGDVIQLYFSGSPMYGHVSGFLFDDPEGAPVHADTLPGGPPDFPVPPALAA